MSSKRAERRGRRLIACGLLDIGIANYRAKAWCKEQKKITRCRMTQSQRTATIDCLTSLFSA